MKLGWRCKTCGHNRESHEHYRAGSDCVCGECKRYRPWLRLVRA